MRWRFLDGMGGGAKGRANWDEDVEETVENGDSERDGGAKTGRAGVFVSIL